MSFEIFVDGIFPGNIWVNIWCLYSLFGDSAVYIAENVKSYCFQVETLCVEEWFRTHFKGSVCTIWTCQ